MTANGDANAGGIPVLTLIPKWLPMGYSKPVPDAGNINEKETKAALQNQTDAYSMCGGPKPSLSCFTSMVISLSMPHVPT